MGKDNEGLTRYLKGRELYGDDFGPDEIEKWHQQERDAFFNMYAASTGYQYEFEAINVHHGFRWLPRGKLGTVLGFGAAYGHELAPIEEAIDRLIIVESASAYRQRPALRVPTEWADATVAGDIPLPSDSVDVATCLGVLHHIPNVTHVLREFARVVRAGGWVLMREPIVSMGDWTRPRPGLTPRERGIPLPLLRHRAHEVGFEIVHEATCMFSGISVLSRVLKRNLYAGPSVVRVDAALSRLFRFNYRYHADTAWQKVRPVSVFMVLRRRLDTV